MDADRRAEPTEVAVRELEHVVWETLPEGLGFHDLRVLVAAVVTYLPGYGGHVPAAGLAAGVTPPSVVAGATLAAAVSLVLVVLPGLLSAGVGALVFTGLGSWTGLEIGALTIPHLEAAGLVAGCSATFYAGFTDHSPVEVVLSGQVTLVTLATDPGVWSAGALVMLLLCKAVVTGIVVDELMSHLIPRSD